MSDKLSTYPIATRVEKVSDTELRLKGFDMFLWYHGYMVLLFYLVLAAVIAFNVDGNPLMKTVNSDQLQAFMADPENTLLSIEDLQTKVRKPNWEFIFCAVSLTVLLFWAAFSESIYSFNKTLRLSGDTIIIGRRKFKRDKLRFISLTTGLVSRYGKRVSYRVNLKMEGWLFTNKCIIPIVKKEEAQKAAEDLSSFLGMQVWDETQR